MRKLIIIFLSSVLLFSCTKKEPYPAVRDMLKRVVAEKEKYFTIDTISKENGNDVFEISSKNEQINIAASSPTAATAAFNYYLKNYCHCFISRMGDNMNLPEVLPVIQEKIRIVTPFKWHYYFNYCTYNYSMAWWTWEDWERELDWMALNGVNMPLAIIGTEAVWQNTLKKFKFTDKECKEFICGPGYNAWWLMCNLEGWGGPVSQQWIDNRTELQKKIVNRMHEYGMTPIFQGFYCMVPAKLKEKYPNNHIIYGGTWAGFNRPYNLDPTDSLFSQMAAVYYEEMEKLYGKTLFYGGDPFHEGGLTEGIDVTASATAIQGAMQKAVPGSKWVLQGWWDNPKDELLNGIDSSKAIILDLFAEGRPNWPRRDCYKKFPWIWSMLQNFGNKNGMYGRLEMVCSEPFRAMNSEKGKSLVGIGTMAEGTDCNPIMWNAVFDMAWQKKAPDMDQWMKDYSYYRYGKKLEKAEQAWNILRKSVYRGPINQEGTKDAIVCARPSLDGSRAWKWHQIVYYYDTIDLQKAWKLLLDCSEELKNIDGYQYDLVDITRQAICDRAQEIHRLMKEAYEKKDVKLFEFYSASFLQLIDDLDRLLATRKEFLLGRWLESAKKCGANDEEKKLFEWNARTLITVWGTKECADGLHEYAMKHWSGLFKDYYYQRWKMYFDLLKERLNGKQLPEIDFYSWEEKWTHQTTVFPEKPQGDAVEISKELFTKYSNKKCLEPYVDKITDLDISKLNIDFIMNTLAFNTFDSYVIYPGNFDISKIVKQTQDNNRLTVVVYLKSKKDWLWSGNLELVYEWSYYEWELASIKNIDFKKN